MQESLVYLILIIIFVSEFAFEELVEFLNFKSINSNIPSKLQDLYDEEEYKKSMLYNKEKARFSFISSFILSFVQKNISERQKM